MSVYINCYQEMMSQQRFKKQLATLGFDELPDADDHEVILGNSMPSMQNNIVEVL
jgi:hypothetical protein